MSEAFISICERRASPNSSTIAVNSPSIIAVTRSGRDRMSIKSAMCVMMSLYSWTILSCSKPVKRCKRICKISCAWMSDKRYRPLSCKPMSGSKPSGRYKSRPSVRPSISRTNSESHSFAIKSVFATGGVGAALIMAMNSSMFANATAKPSKICARSRALRSSNAVRRVTTSRRCSRKYTSISRKLSSFG